MVNAALFRIGNIVTCYVLISTDIITSAISPHESNNSWAEGTINNDIIIQDFFLHSLFVHSVFFSSFLVAATIILHKNCE